MICSDEMKKNYEQLCEVAMVIFSILPTEVQIERDFSSFSHIFSNRRYNLHSKILENILLINLNKSLFIEVNEEEVEELFELECTDVIS